MTIVPIEDRRQELRGLAAALLVLAITWAFHLIGFGDYEIGSLPDIIDQFDLRAAGDPQWGYIGLGYVDVKFGWLHARLHAIPYALGVPLWGLVALQAAGHLLAVLIFWRGLRGHVPEDLRAVSVMALAAEPLPVLMIAENSTALFILAPVIFVAWRWARTPSAAWPHAAAAGLLFALAIHLHFIALFVLPAVYADLFFGRQRSLASTIAFSAAWILAGFVPAANGGLDDLAQLLRGTAEQSGEKPYELWALGFVALAGVHVMATAGSIILLRCRPMHETRLLRDALAWFWLAAIPTVVFGVPDSPRHIGVASGPRALLAGVATIALARALARGRARFAAPALVAAVTAMWLAINLWPSVNGHAPRHPDDFCEKSDTLDYPPNAMSVIRAAAVAAPDIPARDRVFAGLAEYPLNAVRRWQTRDPRPNRAPRIFVAGVRAPGGAAGHYDAGAVTLWRIERPATVIVAAAPGGRTSATITAPPPGDGNDEPSLIAIEIEGMIDNGHPVSGPLDQYMVPSKPHARRGAVEGSPDHDIAAASRDWFASNDCDYAQALVRLAPGASARIVADAPPTAVRAWILQSGAPAPRVRDAQAIVQISRADTAPIVSAPADDGVPPTSIRAYFLAQVR